MDGINRSFISIWSKYFPLRLGDFQQRPSHPSFFYPLHPGSICLQRPFNLFLVALKMPAKKLQHPDHRHPACTRVLVNFQRHPFLRHIFQKNGEVLPHGSPVGHDHSKVGFAGKLLPAHPGRRFEFERHPQKKPERQTAKGRRPPCFGNACHRKRFFAEVLQRHFFGKGQVLHHLHH